jgi:hypothetical protein
MRYYRGWEVSPSSNPKHWKECDICGAKRQIYKLTENKTLVCHKCYEEDEEREDIKD